MKEIKTIINLEKLFNRSSDTYSLSRYPKNLFSSKSILVREDRKSIPSYQARPGPLFYIMHGAGKLSDKKLVEFENALGMNAHPNEMYGLIRAVKGLLKSYGTNLFFTSLAVAGNLGSEKSLAKEINEDGWHYKFDSGLTRLGKSGRVLQNRKGEQFKEVLYLNITPDIVYDGLMNSGLHIENMSLLKDNGDIEIFEEKGKLIKSCFPKIKQNLKSFNPDSSYKVIDLSNIALDKGMKVLEHDFVKRAENVKANVIIKTSFGSDLKNLVQYVSRETDNVFWKLANLGIFGEDPNLNFRECTWHFYNLPHIWKKNMFLGSTGRLVRIANNYSKRKDGSTHAWASNWQSEYVAIKYDANLLFNSIFNLGNSLKQIIGYDQSDHHNPWEIIYSKDGTINPENRVLFKLNDDKNKSDNNFHLDELINMIKTRGLPPNTYSRN